MRYLHLGSTTIQSAMRLVRPNDLELSYTRCMLAFLLFVPEPARVLLIGLGGASLARYIHHRLPAARITAVEINPRVVAAARQFFALPDDPSRLQVEITDGVEYVRGRKDIADAIMIDGFGAEEGAPELATESFYRDCRQALGENGVLVTNLFTRDKALTRYLHLIETVFEGRILRITDEHKGNLIAFGFVRGQHEPIWKTLRRRAKKLAAIYGLEFPAFVEELERLNRRDRHRLFI